MYICPSSLTLFFCAGMNLFLFVVNGGYRLFGHYSWEDSTIFGDGFESIIFGFMHCNSGWSTSHVHPKVRPGIFQKGFFATG